MLQSHEYNSRENLCYQDIHNCKCLLALWKHVDREIQKTIKIKIHIYQKRIKFMRPQNWTSTLYLVDKIPTFLPGAKLSMTKEQFTRALTCLVLKLPTTSRTGTTTLTTKGICPFSLLSINACCRPDPNSFSPFNNTFIIVTFLQPCRNDGSSPEQSSESEYKTTMELPSP